MFDREQARLVESYVRENIYPDMKRRTDFALMGTRTYNGGEQVLYSFRAAPWDMARSAYTIFEITVLIDRQNRILGTGIYDDRGKKLEVLTSRIVDEYLERKASRDLRIAPERPPIVIRSF
jgi:hypothetical protein